MDLLSHGARLINRWDHCHIIFEVLMSSILSKLLAHQIKRLLDRDSQLSQAEAQARSGSTCMNPLPPSHHLLNKPVLPHPSSSNHSDCVRQPIKTIGCAVFFPFVPPQDICADGHAGEEGQGHHYCG